VAEVGQRGVQQLWNALLHPPEEGGDPLGDPLIRREAPPLPSRQRDCPATGPRRNGLLGNNTRPECAIVVALDAVGTAVFSDLQLQST